LSVKFKQVKLDHRLKSRAQATRFLFVFLYRGFLARKRLKSAEMGLSVTNFAST